MKDEIYLGDGVYAVFNGYDIALDLRAEGDDKIVLEPMVIKNLVGFIKYLEEKYDCKGHFKL